MAETASATIVVNQLDATHWQYSLTLDDTGSTTVGTFGFGWVPGQGLLASQPASISDPTGWTHSITNGGPGDGFAIRWVASSLLDPTGTLSGFSFTSTDAPSAIFGNSVAHPGNPVLTSFVYAGAPLADPGFQFQVTPACFRAGTRIRTANGESVVEQLRVGDMVLTASGTHRPVIWVGHRHVDVRRHRSPGSVWPIRIVRGAFGPGMPTRDVDLSPDHAVFVDGNLIPVKCLMNRTTIVQVPTDEVTYYHVELDRHDVMLAEGLPVESYLDAGDRGVFANGGDAMVLYPEFAVRVWEAKAYAPLVVAGPVLADIRQMLDARAELVAQRGELISGGLAINSIAGAKRQA